MRTNDDEMPNIHSANTISLPPGAFANIADQRAGVIFSLYSSGALFPIKFNQTQDRETSSHKDIGSQVISATITGLAKSIKDLKEAVNISLEIKSVKFFVITEQFPCSWIKMYVCGCVLYKDTTNV